MITNAMAAAVGGMAAQGNRFLHIGNNIANSSTTAFKTGDTIFAETLTYTSGRSPSGHRVQPGGGVTILGTEYDFSDGQLLDDEDEFHLGIQGAGFFPVTLGGLDYVSRAGDFSLVPNPGTLPAAGGFVMMRANGAMLQGTTSAGGPIIAGSAGILHFDTAPTSVDIGSDGTLSVLPATVVMTNGNIGFKNYVNTDALIREESQLFLESPLASPVDTANLIVPGSSFTGFLRQKTLEQSNVDLTNEFTKMIVTQRNFQANAKTITTADEMLNVAINVKR
jgi:flagellar hook protein FlgE